MRSSQPMSCDERDDESSSSEPTKRFNSFQFQSRPKISRTTLMNTSRFSENIACAFHKDQKITNFCRSKACLLPLCPKCVGIHCQQHSKIGVFGDFISIDESISQVSTNLKGFFEKLENLEKLIEKEKWSFEDKENRLNANLVEVKHKFMQKVKQLINNFEQAVDNIWSIEMNTQIEHLKTSEEYKNDLLMNYNACLKKLMNPSQRLEGIIHYYYNQDSFNNLEDTQKRIQSLSEQQQLVIECNFGKESTLESALKSNILLSIGQEEIWSEFKILNQRRITVPSKPQKEIAQFDRRFSLNHLNLDNFVSPLQQFSLLSLRSKKQDKI